MRIKETEIWAKMSISKRRLLSRIAPVYNTKRLFKYITSSELDLKNPKGINEKIQYLKLYRYYNNPIITQCVDKYRVREYLKNRNYGFLLPTLYMACDKAANIDFDKLPDSFVIKCNHGCDYNILCNDKNKLKYEKCRRQIDSWMHEDYWVDCCEVQYKFVKKKIIVEEYLGGDIKTYKFYCFNGIPKVLYVSRNGDNGEKDLFVDYYDMNFKHLNIRLGMHLSSPNAKEIEPPKCFDEMKSIAMELSSEFPFVRIDLYDVQGKIYFSEFTFVPTGGFMNLRPEGTDLEWGSWLRI